MVQMNPASAPAVSQSPVAGVEPKGGIAGEGELTQMK